MGFFRSITRAVTNLVKGAVNLVSKVVSSIVSAVTSPFGMNIDVPDYGIGTDQAQAIEGVLLNKDSAVENIPIVYGQRAIGGTRVFVSTNGSNNKYLYVAMVLCEGQISGYNKLSIDDNEVPLSSYAHGVQATPSSGNYANKLVAQFFDGRDDQVASTLLKEAPGWTDNHKLSGLAYIALRYEWVGYNTSDNPNNNPYGGGIPNAKLVVQGKTILDLTTIDPATYNTAYDSDTKAYVNNPVSVLCDYLRSERYGKGLSNDLFDWSSWKTAAELCDQTVTYANATTSAAFTCDAVMDTANTLLSNCKILLASFRGIMPYQGGKYILKIENGGDDTDITATPSDPATVFTVTNEHIIGGVQLEGESKEHKCNRAIITYVDPAAGYQPNDVIYPEEGSADDTAYLAADGARLEKRITLPTVANRKIAEQFARVFVRRSRSQKFITFNTNLTTSNNSVGDLIRVTIDTIGLDGLFRIVDLRVTTDGVVEVNAVEHQSSAYAIDSSGADYTRPSINLPDPLSAPAPTNLVLASGSAYNLVTNSGGYTESDSTVIRLYATWTETVDPYHTSYVVQYRDSADSDWTTAGTTVEEYFFIPGVAVGTAYDVRVASINSLGRRSAYVTVTNHTIQS